MTADTRQTQFDAGRFRSLRLVIINVIAIVLVAPALAVRSVAAPPDFRLTTLDHVFLASGTETSSTVGTVLSAHFVESGADVREDRENEADASRAVPADDSSNVTATAAVTSRQSIPEEWRRAGETLPSSQVVDIEDWLERIINGLVIVMGVAVVAVVLLRMRKQQAAMSGQDSPALHCLAKLRVGSRGQLWLVGAQDCQFLVAVDSTGIRTMEAVPRNFGRLLNVADADEQTLDQAHEQSHETVRQSTATTDTGTRQSVFNEGRPLS